MLADQSLRVLAVRAGLAPETRGVRDEAFRQFVGGQRFPGVQVGQGDFGRGDQIEVASFGLEQIVPELGELTGAEKGSRCDQEGEPDLFVSVLFRLDIQHELDERPLESRAGAGQDRKTGSAELRRARQIEHSERRSKFVMGLRLEVEGGRNSAAANFEVCAFIEPHRHALVGEIGKLQQALLEFLLGRAHPLFLFRDRVGSPRQLLAQPVGSFLLPGPVERADFPILRLQLCSLFADRRLQSAPLFEEIEDA